MEEIPIYHYGHYGIRVEMERLKVDKQGRVYIPSKWRRKLGIEEGGVLEAEMRAEKIVLAEAESVAESSKGIFKLSRSLSPEEIDELAEKYSQERR